VVADFKGNLISFSFCDSKVLVSVIQRGILFLSTLVTIIVHHCYAMKKNKKKQYTRINYDITILVTTKRNTAKK
jgi:hypothetical protein